MKKILFLLSVLFISVNSFAAEKVVVRDTNVCNSEVERLVDKYSGKIEATIISLAESLKQPAEHVYRVMVKQQYIDASIGLFCWIALTLCLIYFVRIFFGKYGGLVETKKDKWGDHCSYLSGTGILSMILGIMIIIFAVAAGTYTQDIFQGFINPEYGAIQDICNLFK